MDPYVEATQVKLKALREEPHTDLLFSTACYSRDDLLFLYSNFNISNDFHPDMSYGSSISFFHSFFLDSISSCASAFDFKLTFHLSTKLQLNNCYIIYKRNNLKPSNHQSFFYNCKYQYHLIYPTFSCKTALIKYI